MEYSVKGFVEGQYLLQGPDGKLIRKNPVDIGYDAPAEEWVSPDLMADNTSDSGMSEWAKGTRAGGHQLQQMTYGLGGLLGNMVGSEGLEGWGTTGYQEEQQHLQALAPRVGSIKDVNGVGDFIDYATYGLGTQVPMALASIGSAGLGGIAAKTLARTTINTAMKDILAQNLAKEVEKKAISSLVNPILKRGALTGTALSSMGMETGIIAGTQKEKTGDYDPMMSLGGGAAAGMLDWVPEWYLIKKLPMFDDAIKGGILKRIGIGGLKQAAMESPTEAMQSVIEQESIPGATIRNQAYWDDILNSAVLGGLGGGVMGGMVGVLPGGKQLDLTKTPQGEVQKSFTPYEVASKGALAPTFGGASGMVQSADAERNLTELNKIREAHGLPPVSSQYQSKDLSAQPVSMQDLVKYSNESPEKVWQMLMPQGLQESVNDITELNTSKSPFFAGRGINQVHVNPAMRDLTKPVIEGSDVSGNMNLGQNAGITWNLPPVQPGPHNVTGIFPGSLGLPASQQAQNMLSVPKQQPASQAVQNSSIPMSKIYQTGLGGFNPGVGLQGVGVKSPPEGAELNVPDWQAMSGALQQNVQEPKPIGQKVKQVWELDTNDYANIIQKMFGYVQQVGVEKFPLLGSYMRGQTNDPDAARQFDEAIQGAYIPVVYDDMLRQSFASKIYENVEGILHQNKVPQPVAENASPESTATVSTDVEQQTPEVAVPVRVEKESGVLLSKKDQKVVDKYFSMPSSSMDEMKAKQEFASKLSKNIIKEIKRREKLARTPAEPVYENNVPVTNIEKAKVDSRSEIQKELDDYHANDLPFNELSKEAQKIVSGEFETVQRALLSVKDKEPVKKLKKASEQKASLVEPEVNLDDVIDAVDKIPVKQRQKDNFVKAVEKLRTSGHDMTDIDKSIEKIDEVNKTVFHGSDQNKQKQTKKNLEIAKLKKAIANVKKAKPVVKPEVVEETKVDEPVKPPEGTGKLRSRSQKNKESKKPEVTTVSAEKHQKVLYGLIEDEDNIDVGEIKKYVNASGMKDLFSKESVDFLLRTVQEFENNIAGIEDISSAISDLEEVGKPEAKPVVPEVKVEEKEVAPKNVVPDGVLSVSMTDKQLASAWSQIKKYVKELTEADKRQIDMLVIGDLADVSKVLKVLPKIGLKVNKIDGTFEDIREIFKLFRDKNVYPQISKQLKSTSEIEAEKAAREVKKKVEEEANINTDNPSTDNVASAAELVSLDIEAYKKEFEKLRATNEDRVTIHTTAHTGKKPVGLKLDKQMTQAQYANVDQAQIGRRQLIERLTQDKMDQKYKRPVEEKKVIDKSLKKVMPNSQGMVNRDDVTTDLVASHISDSNLTSAHKKSLSTYFGGKSLNDKQVLSQIADEIVKFANKGAAFVSESIKDAIRALKKSIVAVAVIFSTFIPMNVTIMHNNAEAIGEGSGSVTYVVPNNVNGMSVKGQEIYNKLVTFAKFQGRPFILADKPNGRIFVFDKDGKLITQSDALYGKADGDRMYEMMKNIDSMNDFERITPSGIYTLHYANDTNQFQLLETEIKDSIIAIHKVDTSDKSEQRIKRLESKTNKDNRISFGCINTDQKFFNDALIPIRGKLENSFVAVVPDNADVDIFKNIMNPEKPRSLPGGDDSRINAMMSSFDRSKQSGRVRGLPLGQVRNLVENMRSKIGNMPEVEIVDNVSELDQDWKDAIDKFNMQEASKALGLIMTINGKVRIVAFRENIDTPRDVKLLMVHEAIGHYGVDAVLGKDVKSVMLEIYGSYKDDPRMQRVLEIGNLSVPETDEQKIYAARELVAEFSTYHRIGNAPLIRKLMDKIRSFLKSIGFKTKWTDEEVFQLLRKSLSSIQEVRVVDKSIENYSINAMMSQEEEQPSGNLMGTWGSVAWDTMVSKVTPTKDIGLFEENAASPEYWQHPVLKQLFELANRRSDLLHDNFHRFTEILKKKVGIDTDPKSIMQPEWEKTGLNLLDFLKETRMIEVYKRAGGVFSEEMKAKLERADRYGNECDRIVDYMSRTNTKWEDIREEFKTKFERPVIDMVDYLRQCYDRVIDERINQMMMIKSAIDKDARERGIEPDYPKFPQYNDQGKVEYKTLAQAINDFGTWKGSYAPRMRRGKFIFKGTKVLTDTEKREYEVDPLNFGMEAPDKRLGRFQLDSELKLRKLKKDLEAQGWECTDVIKEPAVPDVAYSSLKYADMQQILNKAFERMKAGDDSVSSDAVAMQQSALIESLRNEILSHGFRSQLLKRREGDVVEGYEMNSLKQAAEYHANFASGLAKIQTAKDMMDAITPKWETKETEVDGKIVKHKVKIPGTGIDSHLEPRNYAAAHKYITHQLRNADETDKVINKIKQVVTMKFLGMSLRAPIVNSTALLITAPASMHLILNDGQENKIGFAEIMRAMKSGVSDYTKYMIKHKAGELSGTDDNSMFLDWMTKKGFDNPQFTSAALGGITSSTIGSTFDNVVSLTMWLFGKSEQMIRGSVLYTTFRLAAKQAGLDKISDPEEHQKVFDACCVKAEEASLRANAGYNRPTDPLWTMGDHKAAKIGQLFYMYLKFPHNFLQLLYHSGVRKKNYKAMAWLLAAPVALSGPIALPFYTTIMATVSMLFSKLGDDDRDPEKSFWAHVEKDLGPETIPLLRGGVTGAMGWDISGSLATGIEIPTKTTDLFGVFGGFAQDIIEALHQASVGDYSKALSKIAPNQISSFYKAVSERDEGVLTSSGQPVYDREGKRLMPTVGEGSQRVLLGIEPYRFGEAKKTTYQGKVELNKMKARRDKIMHMYRLYAAGGSHHTPEDLQDIKERIDKYNGMVMKFGGKNTAFPMITYNSLRAQYGKFSKLNPMSRRMAYVETDDE